MRGGSSAGAIRPACVVETASRKPMRPDARAEADDPAHMFSVRSYFNLPGCQTDGFFRAVGRLRASRLPGYQEDDMRIGWQATDRLELSLIGQRTVCGEFPGNSAQPRYFQREVALRVTLPDGMIRQPFFRRFVAGAAIVCCECGPGPRSVGTQYNVKAALLLNFARFIEWPDAAFDGAQAPIEVCVLTPSPFGQGLERALSVETVANRGHLRETCAEWPDSAGCHLLYVPAGAESRAGALFHDAGPHTVTVGESRRFESMGGAVTLVIEDGRVRFKVNLFVRRTTRHTCKRQDAATRQSCRTRYA